MASSIFFILFSQIGTSYSQFVLSPDVGFSPTSPLEQFNSGVPSEHIKCHQGLELVVNMHNPHPACVTPTTFTKLISLKWGFDPSHEWTIVGLNDTYKIGQRVDFTIEFHGLVSCCTGFDISITTTDGKIIWQPPFHQMCGCAAVAISDRSLEGPEIYRESKWNVNDLGSGVLSMNNTGQYIVHVADLTKNITIVP